MTEYKFSMEILNSNINQAIKVAKFVEKNDLFIKYN